MSPTTVYKICSQDGVWPQFMFISAIPYMFHFFFTVYGVDQYSDWKRNIECGESTNAIEAEAIFESSVGLTTVFHMVEWIRWTFFLTSVLVGSNMMPVFYFLGALNGLYGVVALIYSYCIVMASPSDCSEIQMERSRYLQLQIMVILLLPIFFSVPFSILKLKGKEWLHEKYLVSKGNEEDSGDADKNVNYSDS